jgi:hypothetical protein
VEVEDYGNASPQQTDDMWRERRAQPVATLEIVGERPQFGPIKLPAGERSSGRLRRAQTSGNVPDKHGGAKSGKLKPCSP